MELKPNSFSTYLLNDSEVEIGSTFSDLNIMLLQNERALIAERKLAVKVDPNDPHAHIRQLIHLEGQFDFATFIIEMAVKRKEEVAAKAREAHEQAERTQSQQSS